MNIKIHHIALALILTLSTFAAHGVLAQEFPPLSKLAQDYLLRTTETSDGNAGTHTVTVVDTKAITRDATVESIETVSRTVEEVNVDKTHLINAVKDSVSADIDSSIVEIRTTTQKPAYELRRSVEAERTQLFENVTRSVEEIKPTQTVQLRQVETEVESSLGRIRANLETESGTTVNFDRAQEDIKNAFFEFARKLEEKRNIIESRGGTLVFEDSDGDGVSDYDETYIYGTDPNNARTIPGDMTDGEKILAGIDPLSETIERKSYQDPREDRASYVTSSYRVDTVQLVTDDNFEKRLVFEGVALPNSYVTLFIYSTPIIVTVKTADSGKWSYELREELENGEHQIYAATVDNSGKIIARSNPILFTKSAEAATIGIIGDLDSSTASQNFLKDNFILITLALLIAVVLIAMMFTGNHPHVGSAINELRNELNPKQ